MQDHEKQAITSAQYCLGQLERVTSLKELVGSQKKLYDQLVISYNMLDTANEETLDIHNRYLALLDKLKIDRSYLGHSAKIVEEGVLGKRSRADEQFIQNNEQLAQLMTNLHNEIEKLSEGGYKHEFIEKVANLKHAVLELDDYYLSHDFDRDNGYHQTSQNYVQGELEGLVNHQFWEHNDLTAHAQLNDSLIIAATAKIQDLPVLQEITADLDEKGHGSSLTASLLGAKESKLSQQAEQNEMRQAYQQAREQTPRADQAVNGQTPTSTAEAPKKSGGLTHLTRDRPPGPSGRRHPSRNPHKEIPTTSQSENDGPNHKAADQFKTGTGLGSKVVDQQSSVTEQLKSMFKERQQRQSQSSEQQEGKEYNPAGTRPK